ncbi:hypothetical protein KR215_006776 [Drosophila sulfurigaster]|nr:hypothetical protein KR215_006776 [Drosophila sulfurigaster]
MSRCLVFFLAIALACGSSNASLRDWLDRADSIALAFEDFTLFPSKMIFSILGTKKSPVAPMKRIIAESSDNSDLITVIKSPEGGPPQYNGVKILPGGTLGKISSGIGNRVSAVADKITDRIGDRVGAVADKISDKVSESIGGVSDKLAGGLVGGLSDLTSPLTNRLTGGFFGGGNSNKSSDDGNDSIMGRVSSRVTGIFRNDKPKENEQPQGQSPQTNDKEADLDTGLTDTLELESQGNQNAANGGQQNKGNNKPGGILDSVVNPFRGLFG